MSAVLQCLFVVLVARWCPFFLELEGWSMVVRPIEYSQSS